jgi:chromosome segregation ATPase
MSQSINVVEAEIQRFEEELDLLEHELNAAKSALDASKAYLRNRRERVVKVSTTLSELREAKHILLTEGRRISGN